MVGRVGGWTNGQMDGQLDLHDFTHTCFRYRLVILQYFVYGTLAGLPTHFEIFWASTSLSSLV